MSAHRADFRSFFRFHDMAAVGADPYGLFTALEHGPVFHFLQQGSVPFFMVLFNGTHSLELVGRSLNPSFSAVSANSLYISVHS